MRKIISQREARSLKKQLQVMREYESKRRYAGSREYPGGVMLTTLYLPAVEQAKLQTARRRSHALVLLPSMEDERVFVFAVPFQPIAVVSA